MDEGLGWRFGLPAAPMKHHDEALTRYVARVTLDPDVLAIVVTGSVARGNERPDSDIDLYLVVTEKAWDRAVGANRIMIVETDGAEYEHGYFDIKLATVSYLDEAAVLGDDPVRDSFAASRILWSSLPDLADRIAAIGVRDAISWQSLEDSFLAQARLHGRYFLDQADKSRDRFLLAHAAIHLASSASRALLARNRVLFQGPKYLGRAIADLPSKPAKWESLIDELVTDPSALAGARVLDALEAFLASPLSFADSLSTFVTDNELAWRTRVSPPEYR